MSKVKKKTLTIFGQDPDIGHLMMEIYEPNREGRVEDMFVDDFSLHSIYLGEARHNPKVGVWKSKKYVIEG